MEDSTRDHLSIVRLRTPSSPDVGSREEATSSIREESAEDSIVRLTLDTQPTDDLTITCIGCGLAKCDREVIVDFPGRMIWAGIHSKCLARLNEKNK